MSGSPTKNIVLDSWAVLAHFEGEERAEKLMQIFGEALKNNTHLFISAVNWGEVLYVIEKRHGAVQTKNAIELMEQMGLEVISVDQGIARGAAHLKANYKLHYTDACAAALALEKKAELITGDIDFKSVESKLKIIWL